MIAKGTKTVVLLVVSACALAAFGVSAASAALPEIGHCVKLEGTKSGSGKKTYTGKFTNRKCTRESKAANGKFEWMPGPGAEKEFESPGALEPVTLETAGGTAIACENSKMFGEYTGAQTETDHIGLYGCKDTATQKPCQSLRPEETSAPTPEEGTILSSEVEGKLGFINGKGSKPEVGWEYKAKTGAMFTFECGVPVEAPKLPEAPSGTLPEVPGGAPAAKPAAALPTELPTLVTIEGAFIGSVKPVDRPVEEFFFKYNGAHGKQTPAMFEGGEAAALTANIVVPKLPPEEKTEAIGYTGIEEESVVEDYEIKAIP